jgi:ATP-binding cassette subfamily G (WHITE) protein 2 (SNQ2)
MLADRKLDGVWSGDICFNLRPRSFWFSQESAYVLQDDCHMASLTVEETLRYAAWTRLPESSTVAQREARVKTLMDIMGLAVLKDNIVGDSSVKGLSGGQLKRLSIAVELIPLPYLIFLDEPTSGLDSSFAYEMISSVRKLTDMKRTVISTIHQPSPEVFKLFHKVVLLSAGLVIYSGPADEAVHHFTRPALGYRYSAAKNPAEFIVDICGGQITPEGSVDPRSADDLRSLFVRSPFCEVSVSQDSLISPDTMIPYIRVHPTSKWTQLKMLMHRSFTSVRRDINDIFAQGLKNSIIGILIGIVFFNQARPVVPTYVNGLPVPAVSNVSALLFFAMLYCLLSNLQAIPILVAKNEIFRREQRAFAYSTAPYWMTQLIASLPLLVFNHVIFTVVVFSMCGFSRSVGSFFYFFFLLLIASVASFYVALFLASSTASSQIAFSIFPIIFLFFGMFSGFTININSVPPLWSWAPYISYSRWVFQGLMVNEWMRYMTDDDTPGGGDGITVLESFNFANANKFNSFWIVVLNLVVITFLVYLAMLPHRSRLSKIAVPTDGDVVTDVIVETPVDAERLSKLSRFSGNSIRGLDEVLLSKDTFAVEDESSPTNRRSGGNGQSFSGGGRRDSKDLESHETFAAKSTFDVAWYRHNTGEVQLSKGCRLVFRNVMYSVTVNANSGKLLQLPNQTSSQGNHKQILKGVSGRAHPGEMCALMGASGAGKSTLLDVLAGRKTVGQIQGEILFNGTTRNSHIMRSAAYVMQDNVHIPQLTVKQTLGYAASLRLPQRTSNKMRQVRITKIMDMLGLNDCANSLVGGTRMRGISGGQMKRLSIGVEIIHMPDLIFLDEPTTGLDSSKSYEVMAAVRNLANQNRTVMSKRPLTSSFND